MPTWESLNHSVWEFKYHVVSIPTMIREYIKPQEREDTRQDQFGLWE